MKLLNAELGLVSEADHLRILELKAENSARRLMIAKCAAEIRRNRAELMVLKNKASNLRGVSSDNAKKPT